MEIKKVNSRDLKKIVKLEQNIFKKNAISKDLMEKLIQNNTFFLKLEIGKIRKQIIGFIIGIRDIKERVNIVNFLIKPKFQNKGYGSYLLQKAIEEVKKLAEIKKIVLNVQISNSTAIKLYEKFNFKRDPTILENYYQSGESAYLYRLLIN
ncbi:MAG: GNAT family N-acetyltransferase [Promethearchaeota archaeon]|nr:MAG: GNAT family N-acetyltransferase [Candidatus Lokiarchaeota archaeon]